MISKFPDYVFINDDSIREVRISNMVRSNDFDAGPPRVTARTCKTLYQLRFDISVCLEDYESYLDWYETVLKQGTQWFLMKCPIRGTEFRFRFLDSDLSFTKEDGQMRKTCTIERWGSGI